MNSCRKLARNRKVVMSIDYKHRDTLRILCCLQQHLNGTSVDDILHSDADKLHVYLALFELEQEKRLEVLEREELGAARIVRLVQT